MRSIFDGDTAMIRIKQLPHPIKTIILHYRYQKLSESQKNDIHSLEYIKNKISILEKAIEERASLIHECENFLNSCD